MTAQIPERIILGGRPLSLFSEPLAPLVELRGLSEAVSQAAREAGLLVNSALWRGYRGTWEIVGDRLHLVHLNVLNDDDPADDDDEAWHFEAPCPPQLRRVLLRAIPADDLPVAAEWFSGELTVQIGRRLVYRHAPFAHVFERERRITVAGGRVVDDKEIDTGAELRRRLEHDPALRAQLVGRRRKDPLGPIMWLDESTDDNIEDEWPPDYVRSAGPRAR